MNQAGRELPSFNGIKTRYGNGLGGIFHSLFWMAVMLLKRGFSIVKPHLKEVATNSMRYIMSNIVRNTSKKAEPMPHVPLAFQ